MYAMQPLLEVLAGIVALHHSKYLREIIDKILLLYPLTRDVHTISTPPSALTADGAQDMLRTI